MNKNPFEKLQNAWQKVSLSKSDKYIILQYCQDSAMEVVYDFFRFQSQFWYPWKLLHCFMNSAYFIQLLAGSGTHKKNISSNYWQLADPYKRMHDPIIGTFIHNLDNTAPEIHVPISLCLIQILDVFFHSNQKSHYISSYFWMPGRIFTTV